MQSSILFNFLFSFTFSAKNGFSLLLFHFLYILLVNAFIKISKTKSENLKKGKIEASRGIKEVGETLMICAFWFRKAIRNSETLWVAPFINDVNFSCELEYFLEQRRSFITGERTSRFDSNKAMLIHNSFIISVMRLWRMI